MKYTTLNFWKPKRWKARLFPNGKREARYKQVFLFLGIAFLLGVCLRGVEKRLTPMLLEYAAAEAENMALRMAGKAVEEALREEGLEYEDILVFSTRADGCVTACKTDTTAINRLQATVVDRLTKYYKQKQAVVSVPLGNISQSSFLYGRGPDIRFPVVPVGRIALEYGNEYESCGINQTRHSLYFTLNMAVRVSGSREERLVTCSGTYPIAEAVIVGYVPESYTDVTWNRSE